MSRLTQPQLNFLSNYFREFFDGVWGPAMELGKQGGFTPDHFQRLYQPFVDSWGGDLSNWDGPRPPVTALPDQLPWTFEELAEINGGSEELGRTEVSCCYGTTRTVLPDSSSS